MATETVASAQIPTTDDEQVGKKAEDKKAEEQVDIALTKESGEEICKTEDSTSLEIPPKSEAVEYKIEPSTVEAEKIAASDVPHVNGTKVENDHVFPKQVVDVLTKESGGDICKNEDSSSLEIPPKSEAVEYEKIEPPTVEAEKTADAPASDVPHVNETKVENDPVPEIPKQVVDVVDIPEEVESSIEPVVKEEPKEPATEIIEERQVEQPNIVDPPQSSYEVINKPEEQLEVTTDKESVEKVQNDIKDSELESLEELKQEHAAAEVEEKPGEPSEPILLVEKKLDGAELEKSVEDEVVKDEGSAADKMVPIPVLEELKPENAVTEVEEKPREPSELSLQVEKRLDEVKLEKTVEDEMVKDEGSAADKFEPTPVLEERKTEADDTPTLEVKEAPEQGAKVQEEVKSCDEVEPEKSLKDDIVISRESSSGKVEDSTYLDDGKTDKDNKPGEIKSSQEVLLNQGEVTQTFVVEDKKNDVSAVDVVEKLPKEAALEIKKVGEDYVETEKTNVLTVDSTQPIKDGGELSGVDVVEKLAEDAEVKLEMVGEENVENEEKEKGNAVTEELTDPIKEVEKKELSGLDVVKKLAEEKAVELEKVGENNEEPEDEKKESTAAHVTEKLADEAVVKLEDAGEENVGKTAETEESEKKNVILEDLNQPILEDQKIELSGVDVVKKLADEAALDKEKVGEEIEAKNVKCEGEGNVISEASTQQAKEDVRSSIITPSAVLGKSFEGDGKDVKSEIENETADHIKEETPVTVETTKDEKVEEESAEATTLVTEPLEESKQSESAVKGEEPVELEKAVDDVTKSDQKVELPAKDDDDTKPSQDLPKEVPAKLTQKQSNTILSKVKQTLVKAKRVITGKSPSSKTAAPETKDEIKVK